ncbi:MAG: tetratricopeptide repeat protein [Methylococcales bacterium]
MRKKMLGNKSLAFYLLISFVFLLGCDGAAEREAKYLKKAQGYYEEGNYDKMRVELKNVLQINPKNIDARYLTALAAEKNQDWRKMYGNLLAVVEAKPDHYDAQIKLGKLMLFSKDIAKASEKAELVLASQPNNADALALKATIALANKDVDVAKVLLNQALTAEPGHYDSSLLMIKILGDEKNITEAKQVLENALKAHPDKLQLELVKINFLLFEEKKDEAEALYVSLLPRFPENEGLYYNLAKLYISRDKIDLAEGVLKKLVTQLPEEDKPKFVLIDFLIRKRGVEQAEKEIDSLIAENPDNFGFRFAKLALYKEQPEKSQKILEAIVEDDKLGAAGIDARNRLAGFFNAKGKPDKARILVEEILELDSRNKKALLLRAGLSLKDKKFDAALADARTILRDNPESEKALMIQAVTELQDKNIELAKETLEKIITINPKNAVATKDLARIKLQTKDEVGAIEILEKARPILKKDPQISIMLIDLYGKQKQWDKAEKIAKDLLQQPKNKEIAHYKLAQLYMGQQKFDQAIVEFQKVRTTKPKAVDAIAGLVNSYVASKQQVKAVDLLDSILSDNKDNPTLLTMRAELYRQMKQLPKAEVLFKKVIALKPKVEIGYKNLASIYMIQKQINKVTDVFQQGLKQIPESKYFLMQLGILNTVAGNVDKAIEAYKKLLAIVPGNVLAVNNLASLLIESSDDKAVEQAYSLIEPLKDSKYPAFLDTYGWVNYKKGNIDIALAALESVIKQKGVVPEMHYHLGIVYIDKGRVEEAKLELEKAIAGNAKFKGIDVAKKALDSLNKAK